MYVVLARARAMAPTRARVRPRGPRADALTRRPDARNPRARAFGARHWSDVAGLYGASVRGDGSRRSRYGALTSAAKMSGIAKLSLPSMESSQRAVTTHATASRVAETSAATKRAATKVLAANAMEPSSVL